MQNLDKQTWQAFRLGDIADIRSGRDIYAGERRSGDTPYVTSGTANNGIGYFVDNDNDSITSNAISVNRNGSIGEAFYHPYPALYGNDCRRVILRDYTDAGTQLFVAHAISKQKQAFSYSRKLGSKRLTNLRIMLPVNSSGAFDDAYMSEYIKQKEGAMLMKYHAYAEQQITKIGDYAKIPKLSEKQWNAFRISDLFKVNRPAARNKNSYQIGDVPFIASGCANNGVMKFCSLCINEPLDTGNCITVSPVDGSTFYQPMNFLGRGGAGSSILILRSKSLNLYRGEFIARMIQQTCSKYTYGHMGNTNSIKRERIMLPITTDSQEPDYAYMEQYVKNMMLHKYEQYLTFLEGKTRN
jgi:hypothetical protein